MAIPNITRQTSFDQWRLGTNQIANSVGDVSLLYTTDGSYSWTPPSIGPIVAAINDLNTRKVSALGGVFTDITVAGVTAKFGFMSITSNAYWDPEAFIWKYSSSGYASRIAFNNSSGVITISGAPTGAANSTVTWATAITVTSTGGVTFANPTAVRTGLGAINSDDATAIAASMAIALG